MRAGLILFSLAIVVLVTQVVQAQIPPPPLENLKIDVTIEAKDDGICLVEASVQGPPIEAELLAQFPFERGEARASVSSPSPRQLVFEAEGSFALSEKALREMPPEAKAQLGLLSKELANFMLAQFHGKPLLEILALVRDGEVPELPPQLVDLKLENIWFERLLWSEPELGFKLSLRLSGTVFENEEFQRSLPFRVKALIDASPSSVSLTLEFKGSRGEASFGFLANPQQTRAELSASFELPKVGNRVRWRVGAPTGSPELAEALTQLLERCEVSFTLKVPENARVTGLPSGYSQLSPGTYTWSKAGGREALSALAGGAPLTISYAPAEQPAARIWVAVVAIGATAAAVLGATLLKRRK